MRDTKKVIKMLKVEKYYDIGCSKCGRHISTDFSRGMYRNIETIRKLAKSDGWTTDSITGENICPICRFGKGQQ